MKYFPIGSHKPNHRPKKDRHEIWRNSQVRKIILLSRFLFTCDSNDLCIDISFQCAYHMLVKFMKKYSLEWIIRENNGYIVNGYLIEISSYVQYTLLNNVRTLIYVMLIYASFWMNRFMFIILAFYKRIRNNTLKKSVLLYALTDRVFVV